MTSTVAQDSPVRTGAQRPLRITLYTIAFFQFALGAAFLAAPVGMARLLGLPTAPGWTNWLFAMMAARFLGYGIGMVVAARDPRRHRLWIDTMIMIQGVDWLATVIHVAQGDVTLRQVTTAAVLPVVFILALFVLRPRRRRTAL